ncbi:Coronin-like protein crn1 [Babesia sp. Xinjiang]|uniref:Coronin-like protein crn1 n=1 Tax=Babesia sp. Xinjiang TaxID=462227 RepID=UPI000A225747|nr:Coronin-like protein crn1 [Babesia sp. Xinjiang]ORM39941.1 Coronin-like protein crn1 [Babesia sp. Xinjiang]
MATVRLKNVFGEPFKQVYCDLKINPKPTAFSAGMAASTTHIAFPWEVGGGGLISLINMDKLGRNSGLNRVDLKGHAGSLQDMSFNDFDYNLLASASDDCSVRVWRISSENSALCNLSGHTKKTTNVMWNSATDYVLMSGSMDNTVRVWDVQHEASVSCISIDGQYSYCNWSYDGETMLVATKEACVLFADPRDGKVTSTFKAHDSNKATSVQWLGGAYGSDHLATTGYVGNQTRQIRIWDARNTAQPLVSKDIDSAPGPLIPHWDSATGLLTVVGKGDLTVRIFQYLEGDLNRAGEIKCTGTIKSFCFIPSSACDKSKCELGRMLYNSTCKEINPISVVVLRRNSEAAMDEIYGGIQPRRRTVASEWHGCDLGTPQKSMGAPSNEASTSASAQVPAAATKTPATPSVASPSVDWESTPTGRAFIDIIGSVNGISIRFQPTFDEADMISSLESLKAQVEGLIGQLKVSHGISTPVRTATLPKSEPSVDSIPASRSSSQNEAKPASQGLNSVKAAIAAMEARAQAKTQASARFGK